MRFISQSAKFALQIRPQMVENYASGAQRVTQEPIYCDFQLGMLTDDERAFALTQFAFDGGFQNQDEVTMTDPIYRLSVYDTDQEAAHRGWDAQTKAHVEEKLLHHAANYSDIIVMPGKILVPPWPRYDDYEIESPALLVRKLIDEGYDLVEVLAYERSSQDRPEVVGQIEQVLVEIEEGELVEEVVG